MIWWCSQIKRKNSWGGGFSKRLKYIGKRLLGRLQVYRKQNLDNTQKLNSNLKILLVITKIMIIGNNVVLHPFYTWRIVACVKKTLIILWFMLMLHVWGFSILQVQYFHQYVRQRWMNMLVVFTIISFLFWRLLLLWRKVLS